MVQRGTKTISTSDISAKTTLESNREGYIRNSVEYVFVWVVVCSSSIVGFCRLSAHEFETEAGNMAQLDSGMVEGR